MNKDHSVFKEKIISFFSFNQHCGLILSCADVFIVWNRFSGEQSGPLASCKSVTFKKTNLNQRTYCIKTVYLLVEVYFSLTCVVNVYVCLLRLSDIFMYLVLYNLLSTLHSLFVGGDVCFWHPVPTPPF